MSDSDRASQNSLIATTAVLTSLSTSLVLTRSVIRFGLLRKPGWDDCMIAVAMVFTIGYFAVLLVARANKIGFPMTMLTPDNMYNLLKATFAIELIYYTIIFGIKTSIVFMYLRFAVSKIFRKLCYGTLVLLTIFFIICFSGTLGQCQPLNKAWDITRMEPGTCINTTAFFYFTSGFNIITDFWILLLPIPTLKSIHIAPKEKYGLYCIFGIGIFATALSIVRLQSIYTYTLSTDPFHDAIKVNLWSIIEVNSAIVCANIPALKPLFKPRSLLESMRGRGKSSGYEYHSSERSGGGAGKSAGSGSGGSGHSRADSAASAAGFAPPPPNQRNRGSPDPYGRPGGGGGGGFRHNHIAHQQRGTPSSEETIGLEPLPEAYLKV